jgi:3-oxoacyl-[acyl-carrier protein] reductase
MTPASSSAQPWLLTGKTAVVTGGSRGIGRAIAIQFARKGLDKIAITYSSNSEAAEATLDECRSLGVSKTVAIQVEVTDPQFGPLVVQKAHQGLDTTTIDILVNNAGVGGMEYYRPFEETTADTFLHLMHGNVYSAYGLTRECMAHFPPKGGRVINISSAASRIANPSPTFVHGAAKAALESITRSFASEFGVATGATFTSVSVGTTDTDAFKKARDIVPAEYLEAMMNQSTAEKRLGTPEDIAYIVGFLASEEARWVQGASISANGGMKEALAALG